MNGIELLRNRNRVIFRSGHTLRVHLHTPTAQGIRRGVHELVHDGRGISDGTSDVSISDAVVYVRGITEQHYTDYHYEQRNGIHVFACIRIGIESDILTHSKDISDARRVSVNGAQQMTLTLVHNYLLNDGQAELLRTALNRAISDSLGVEYHEWFVSPECDTSASSSGLVLCAPENSRIASDEEELIELSVQAGKSALAKALVQYYTHIS